VTFISVASMLALSLSAGGDFGKGMAFMVEDEPSAVIVIARVNGEMTGLFSPDAIRAQASVALRQCGLSPVGDGKGRSA
jgi:hypothetical protein